MNFAPPTVFPFWASSADLAANGVGEGVFTQTLGDAPNWRFIVEWRGHKPGMPDRDRRFEVVFYESSPVITTVYCCPASAAPTRRSAFPRGRAARTRSSL